MIDESNEESKNEATRSVRIHYSERDIESIIQSFNILVILFFCKIFFTVLSMPSIIISLFYIAYVISIYYAASRSRLSYTWLYVFLAFIPLINWISFIFIVYKISDILSNNGYKIGFLGPKKL